MFPLPDTSLHCSSPRVPYTQVVAAPNAGTPQVQAAQNFKELSDKVANARGDSRGKKRSPKGQAAAARARRLGRGGSKPPSPPSSSGGGRRRSSVLPRAGGSGGGSSVDGGGKQLGRPSRSSRASFSQQRRRSVRSSRDSSSISSSKNNRSSAQREAVESSGGEGGGQQTRSAELSLEAEGLEAPDSTIAQDRSEDSKQLDGVRNQQQPRGDGNSSQDDAVEPSDVTGTIQRQDGALSDTSVVEETLSGNALSAVDGPTLPLQGAVSTSETTKSQDGSDNTPPGPSSSAMGHTQQEENGGASPVDLEGSGNTGSSPVETEQYDREREEEQLQPWPEQHEEVPEEDDELSLSMAEEVGKAAEAGFLGGTQEEAAEPNREAGDDDGGAKGVRQPGPAAAAIDFVPTERSLAAYCQVRTNHKIDVLPSPASGLILVVVSLFQCQTHHRDREIGLFPYYWVPDQTTRCTWSLCFRVLNGLVVLPLGLGRSINESRLVTSHGYHREETQLCTIPTLRHNTAVVSTACEVRSSARFIFVSSKPSVLIAFAKQAAARCKLAIEAFEVCSSSSSSDSSSELDSDSGDDGVAAREKDKHKQRLVERYAHLTDAMMDWGVEVSRPPHFQIYIQRRKFSPALSLPSMPLPWKKYF